MCEAFTTKQTVREAMTMAYHRYHGVDTRIVRIFNTYGPRMRPKDGRVVSNSHCRNAGQALTVFGDGLRHAAFAMSMIWFVVLWRYLHAKSDKSVAERTDRTKFSPKTGCDFDSIHDPVNIGNPRELTVRGLRRLSSV